MTSLSPAQYREMIAKASAKQKNKFNAKKTIVGSFTFDSKAEATRYSELRVMEHRGEISELELQPEFPLIVNGAKVGLYKADFRYRDRDARRRVEDVKSKATITPQYRLKKKLAEALYPGLLIEEVEVRDGRGFVRQQKPSKLARPRKRKVVRDGAGAAAQAS